MINWKSIVCTKFIWWQGSFDPVKSAKFFECKRVRYVWNTATGAYEKLCGIPDVPMDYFDVNKDGLDDIARSQRYKMESWGRERTNIYLWYDSILSKLETARITPIYIGSIHTPFFLSHATLPMFFFRMTYPPFSQLNNDQLTSIIPLIFHSGWFYSEWMRLPSRFIPFQESSWRRYIIYLG